MTSSQTEIEGVPFTLYHGTSTLFLESIIENGLGGVDPIREWRILDFARELWPIVESNFSQTDLTAKVASFGRMVRQENSGFNFQHGDTYLTPSLLTAVRYASNTRYGSELLTYTMDFLSALLDREVPGLRDNLYKQFPDQFGLLDISPAPLLVSIDKLPEDAIALDERGGTSSPNLRDLRGLHAEDPSLFELLAQQSNFRLTGTLPVEQVNVRFINVTQWNPIRPKFKLYPLELDQALGQFDLGPAK